MKRSYNAYYNKKREALVNKILKERYGINFSSNHTAYKNDKMFELKSLIESSIDDNALSVNCIERFFFVLKYDIIYFFKTSFIKFKERIKR